MLFLGSLSSSSMLTFQSAFPCPCVPLTQLLDPVAPRLWTALEVRTEEKGQQFVTLLSLWTYELSGL